MYYTMNWVGSHLFFVVVLKMYYFGFCFVFFYYNFGVVFLWQCLDLHSLPLLKYKYLMSVYFIVCEGKFVKQYFILFKNF